MDVTEAKARVERAFAKLQKSAARSIIVIDEATIEKPYGYVFFVNTKRYLETGERRYAAIGAGRYEAGGLTGTLIGHL